MADVAMTLHSPQQHRRWLYGLPLLAVFAAVPFIGNAYYTNFAFLLLVAFVLAQSWDWVGGEMGYVNLGHLFFYGVGAYTFCILVDRGVGVSPSFIAAVLTTCVFAAILAFPLFRLQGDYFAFATLTLLPLAQLLAFNLSSLTKGGDGISLPPHYVLNVAYGLILIGAVAAVAVTAHLSSSRFGIALRSIRNDEQVSETLGIRILPVKVAVLVLSAAFAGFAGAIQAWHLSFIDPNSVFGVTQGLVPIAMALLGGSGLMWGPAFGVLVLGSAQQWLLANIPFLHAAIYGVIILLIGRFMPGGLLRWPRLASIPMFAFLGQEHKDKFFSDSAAVNVSSALVLTPAASQRLTPILECRNLTKAFRGLVAVNDVSFSIMQGEIIGLVGPNGSGKTTLFNCISKVYEPTKGQILFDGKDIAGLRRDEISRLGVGRTYQIPRPLSDLSVRENVAVSLLFRDEGTSLRNALESAESFARYVGLGARLSTRSDALGIQEKKSLELARALACRPRLLLVDEVASGLTPVEVKTFVAHLRELRDKYNVTVIWVEHIFSALAECVDRLVVLESGSVIADEPLATAVKNERVLSTYLGSNHGAKT